MLYRNAEILSNPYAKTPLPIRQGRRLVSNRSTTDFTLLISITIYISHSKIRRANFWSLVHTAYYFIVNFRKKVPNWCVKEEFCSRTAQTLVNLYISNPLKYHPYNPHIFSPYAGSLCFISQCHIVLVRECFFIRSVAYHSSHRGSISG